jgi:hypothetical protein
LNEYSFKTKATFPKYICASERVKLIGTIDGRFPDFGHHSEKEMGGLWLHPIKLLDGFWLRLCDHSAEDVNVWLIADEYEVKPFGNKFAYGSNLGHTRLKIVREQYCPEEAAGLLIKYEITNTGDTESNVSLEFLARTDLRPVWFSDTAGIKKEGGDKVLDHEADPIIVKGDRQPWYVAIGSDRPHTATKIGQHFGPEITSGEGISISLLYDICVQAKETYTLCIFIAGSYESELECKNEYQNLLSAKKSQ